MIYLYGPLFILEHFGRTRTLNSEDYTLTDEEYTGRSVDIFNTQKSAIQLCANRLVLICIMAGFFLFFASAISFIVYLMVKNREKSYSDATDETDLYGSGLTTGRGVTAQYPPIKGNPPSAGEFEGY